MVTSAAAQMSVGTMQAWGLVLNACVLARACLTGCECTRVAPSLSDFRRQDGQSTAFLHITIFLIGSAFDRAVLIRNVVTDPSAFWGLSGKTLLSNSCLQWHRGLMTVKLSG